jgi:hypothetical protein
MTMLVGFASTDTIRLIVLMAASCDSKMLPCHKNQVTHAGLKM